MGSVRNLKNSLTGEGGFLTRNVPKDGITVRILQEPTDWVGFRQHWDDVTGRPYPHAAVDCPGCADGDSKPSKKYLVNAVDIAEDKVVALVIPQSAAQQIFNRFEKDGTVTSRNFEIDRQGEGKMNTKYFVSPEPESKMRLNKYEDQLHDLLEILDQQWESVFGGGESESDEDEVQYLPKAKAKVEPEVIERPTMPKPKSSMLKPFDGEPEDFVDSAEDDLDDDVEDIEEDFSDDDADDVAVDDDDADDDDDDDDGPIYDEDDLRAMSLGQVKQIARTNGIDVKGKEKDAIIDELLDQADELV